MIGITQKNTILNVEFGAAHYSEAIKKHTLMFKYLGGEINILIDREEFGSFMRAVVESYTEGTKHLLDEMKEGQ